jgi:hypothetical protein
MYVSPSSPWEGSRAGPPVSECVFPASTQSMPCPFSSHYNENQSGRKNGVLPLKINRMRNLENKSGRKAGLLPLKLNECEI